MKKKWVKISIFVFCILLVLFIGGGFYAGNFFYNLALNPHTDKSTVFDAEENQIEIDESYIQSLSVTRDWWSEIGYKNVVTPAYDEITLHGYLLENQTPSKNWIIIVHGYMSDALTMVDVAKNFYNLGYNILLPDCRGLGESEGDYIAMGYEDRLDIIYWANAINRHYEDAQIVLYGVSMGAAGVMMAACEESLPENVVAVVADCGYTGAWEEFSYQLHALFGLPEFPLLHFTDVVTRIRAGYSFRDVDTKSALERLDIPIMIIHGSEDTFVPVSMAYELYEIPNVQKELYIVPGAGHGLSYIEAGDEYFYKIENFLAPYIALGI